MFKNNLKIAWRSFIKNRQFTLLNLVGLSTGLACALLIYLWVHDELQVDRFHQKDSQLYQVLSNMENSNEVQTIPETNVLLARTLKTEMPEVEYASAALKSSFFGNITLSAKENNIKAVGQFVEPDFLRMFSYPLLHGNLNQVLTNKSAIVISKTLANKLFHTTENLIGKTILWQHNKQYIISGILNDVSESSSVQFDFLIPFDNFLDSNPWEKNWGNGDPSTYVVLKKGTNVDHFNQKLAGFMQTKLKESNQTLFARPYSKGYLFGNYENGFQTGGRIEYVQLFSLIALFILVIACINFMNLSTAKASQRLKEVGIKKAVGASRSSLILQYLNESLLLTFLCLLIAIVFVILLLPQFNNITGKHLALNFNLNLITLFLAITLLTGLLSGSYPAIYLSGFNPAVVLKGKLKSSLGELWVRKGLVVFQFTLSVILIIAMLVVYQQIQYIQTKNAGYNKDNILSFDMTATSAENTNTFLSEAKNIPGVVNISSMDHSSLIGSFGSSMPNWEGKDPKTAIVFGNVGINYNMIETLGLQVQSGRSFSRKISADDLEVILNEAAVEAMGIKNPIGKWIDVFGDGRRKIVGIVKDFHFQSLHEQVKPFALRLSSNTNAIMAKITAGTEKQTAYQLQQLYQKYHPGYSFDYRFLDDDYQAQYVAEKRVDTLSRYFGALGILISCLGLFGLAAFTAERRFKEIGVRKVLGASVNSVVLLLSKDFLKLVLVAAVIAFPLSWLAMNQWLKGFAYRTSIGISIFLIAGISIMLIALATVSFQAIKAALANPVKSLRSE